MVNFKELLGNDNQLHNLLLDTVEEMVKAIDDVVAKEKSAQISYDDEHHSISLSRSVPWRTMLRFLMYRHIR